MKKLILPLVALVLFSFSKDSSARLSTEDRKMMIKHLTETREHMNEVLDGLTYVQFHYKPDPTSWSIAECVEHLALTEKMFVQTVHKSVEEGPKPALKDSLVLKTNKLCPWWRTGAKR